MCGLNGYKTMTEKTLEEYYKGCRHNVFKFVQESQGEIDCYV